MRATWQSPHVDAEAGAREEFAATRVFPSLLEARLSGGSAAAVLAAAGRPTREVFIEDEQLRAARAASILAREKRRGNALKHRQGLSGFRPTSEVTCLADLREQIKRRNTKDKASRKKADQTRSAALANGQGAPFRPCNPREARETLAAPQGGLAKNPYGRDIGFPKDVRRGAAPSSIRCDGTDGGVVSGGCPRRPTPPAHKKRWAPISAPISSGRTRGGDLYLNAPDAESALRERKRAEKLRSQLLTEFKDHLMVRNATNRTKTLIGYLARVEARMIRDQQARALEQARARAEATMGQGFRKTQSTSRQLQDVPAAGSASRPTSTYASSRRR